jgi:hypothetical protein
MKKVVVLLMVLGVTSMASAISVWTGNGADTNWMTTGNWDTGALPSMSLPAASGGLAKIYKTTGVANALINSAGPQALEVKVGGPNPPTSPATWSTLTIATGGVLNVGEYLMIGIDSTVVRSGEVDMTGGTVNLGQVTPTSGHLYLGYAIAGTQGILRMSGDSTINATADFKIAVGAGCNGYAYLSGNATINANTFTMNVANSTASTSLLDIRDAAKIVINGDIRTKVQGYIDNGWIKSNGVTIDDYSILSYSGGKTIIAVPEPATMCLLGLGALSLIRRKKLS